MKISGLFLVFNGLYKRDGLRCKPSFLLPGVFIRVFSFFIPRFLKPQANIVFAV